MPHQEYTGAGYPANQPISLSPLQLLNEAVGHLHKVADLLAAMRNEMCGPQPTMLEKAALDATAPVGPGLFPRIAGAASTIDMLASKIGGDLEAIQRAYGPL